MGLHLPPTIALFCTIAFVIFLFRRDSLQRPNITGALWLPLLWVLLIGSRSVAQWLNVLNFPVALGSVEEGNPLDAFVYFVLIATGLYILAKRQISLAEVFRENKWLMAFLVYCFIAILWSDFPFVAFKRWIKILGHPIMVLILFTEPDFEEALVRLMKRSAYVLVPFSILLIKYYPEIGRSFDPWSGLSANSGVGTSKNMLGGMCLVLSFFFVWHFLQTRRAERSKARRNEILLIGGFLFMILWLFRMADSATALVCLLIGILVMVLLERPWMNKKLIGTYVLLAIGTLVVAEFAFGISGKVADVTGHSATLIGRGELWHELLALDTNPIFGVGFESFWLGDRLRTLSETHWWSPNEAHNGYLEIYLDLGLVGLFMLAGLIIETFWKIRVELLRNLGWGQFRLGFLAAVVFYNWTEATFKGLSLLWFVFYIIAMEYTSPQLISQKPSFEGMGEEEEMEPACFRI